MRTRILAGVLTALVLLVVAAPASASYITAWRHVGARIVRHNNRYYAQWQCDVGGTVVASGAWWIWMTPAATALGVLAGVSFTVGCHMARPQATYQVGVPYVMSECAIIYPHGNRRRRFEVCAA